MKTLQGKKALILGGSRGIGAAIVKRFARDGAEVTFTYHSAADAANKLAGEVNGRAVRADSTKPQEVSAVIAAQGALDILVINAGIAVFGDPLTLAAGDIDRMIDLNIRGPYHAAVDGDRGITVNNVQPGPVDTDMNPADGPMKDLMHSFMALKRHARPDEIAGMVAYLAGPEADMVTGAQHTIDGGFGA